MYEKKVAMSQSYRSGKCVSFYKQTRESYDSYKNAETAKSKDYLS